MDPDGAAAFADHEGSAPNGDESYRRGRRSPARVDGAAAGTSSDGDDAGATAGREAAVGPVEPDDGER